MEAALTKRKGKSTSRQEQRAETRDAVKRAAFELFSTAGFDETTTQEIATRAGVAAGTVFLHASDKIDLLSLVMHDVLDEVVAERFASLPDGLLIDRLCHVFRGVFAMYGKYPKMGSAFVRTLPAARGPNADRVNTLTFGFLHRIGMLITDAQAKGEVASDLVPTLCAQNIFGLYFMTLMSWLAGHVQLEALEPLFRMSIELQIRGFRP
jgi:AcrR family transcriptional regulator